MATAIQERTIPPMNTLVKFDNPVLVAKHREKVRIFEIPSGYMLDQVPCGEITSLNFNRSTVVDKRHFGRKSWQCSMQNSNITAHCGCQTRNDGNFKCNIATKRVGRRWSNMDSTSFELPINTIGCYKFAGTA